LIMNSIVDNLLIILIIFIIIKIYYVAPFNNDYYEIVKNEKDILKLHKYIVHDMKKFNSEINLILDSNWIVIG
jgi:hypothetical protein